ncbi:peptide chain release factor N(5)-glutamine methyltransferase [Hydrogenovibrio marinus]|uniref:Release factor glutamine methyltransferase n=1 Tax=Hydrogenovibrio marinus TaxID=28885 RepID=A0A066ZQG5_HYDMR|nr:peptide chain release factor N(5)-glutamine methyltransferase [Hydrogenovibrio marinus]KDN95712.1 SAM-dependent methyltransferase [Hydrogenovibrio marinus]BBN58807.1 release factor glutamine methyltransferase [Hydrogenovibrio marinus]
MTIAEALNLGRNTLTSESPLLDAEILLAYTLDKDRTYLFTWPEHELSAQQAEHFSELLKKRQVGVPVAHLTGNKEFWGLDFKVTSDTLIPRPDTEILVEQALLKIKQLHQDGLNARVLDLGTGSGAIICALKHEAPYIEALAVDLQPAALTVAKQNAEQHGLSIDFRTGSWFEPMVNARFEVIVSNPPYIVENDPHLSQGDVRFEPLTALTSGQDGLEDIRTLISESRNHLVEGGWLLIEHGFDQEVALQKLFADNSFEQVETIYDYGHNPRVTLGQYKNKKDSR